MNISIHIHIIHISNIYIYFILYVLDMHLISIARENGNFLRRLASLLWGSAWNPIIIRLVMELGPFIINKSLPTYIALTLPNCLKEEVELCHIFFCNR